MNPTRLSVWDDPAFVGFTDRWGAFYRVSRELAEESGRVLVTPIVNYLDIALGGRRRYVRHTPAPDTTRGSLERAAREIDEMAAGIASG